MISKNAQNIFFLAKNSNKTLQRSLAQVLFVWSLDALIPLVDSDITEYVKFWHFRKYPKSLPNIHMAER